MKKSWIIIFIGVLAAAIVVYGVKDFLDPLDVNNAIEVADKFAVGTDGKVAIGKASTVGALLDIDSSAFTMSALNIFSAQSAPGFPLVRISSGNIGHNQDVLRISGAGTGNLLVLQDGAVDTFVVKDGGSVGIGTDAPSEKLDVVGKVKGQELCIGNDCRSVWPAAGAAPKITPSVMYLERKTATGINTMPNCPSGWTSAGTGFISVDNDNINNRRICIKEDANCAVMYLETKTATGFNTMPSCTSGWTSGGTGAIVVAGGTVNNRRTCFKCV